MAHPMLKKSLNLFMIEQELVHSFAKSYIFLYVFIRLINYYACILHFHLNISLAAFNKSFLFVKSFQFCSLKISQTYCCRPRVFCGGVQTKKMFQLVSQCHHSIFCPLIPKLYSVKSEHYVKQILLSHWLITL